MITLRPAAERGAAHHGWLDTRHTFSFANYYDPRHMGFRSLRVLNDDRVAPGAGFPPHPHRDMEILTWVVDGAIAHRDSLGHGEVLRAGELQRMTAGTGVVHSEFNASRTEPLRFLQIWVRPEAPGLPPSYQQRPFPPEETRGRLRLVASRDGEDGALTVHQDLRLYVTRLPAGATVTHRLAPGRHAWVQVVRGALALGELRLGEGDGVAMSEEPGLTLTGLAGAPEAEALVFDLA
jgi:redox-sensitive bicupin YhaK (pirin superfamily)